MENLDNVLYKKPVIRQFENVTGHHWFNQLEKREWMVVTDYGHKCDFSILPIDLWSKFIGLSKVIQKLASLIF